MLEFKLKENLAWVQERLREALEGLALFHQQNRGK